MPGLKKRRLLDSYALLAYLDREDGCERVLEVLSKDSREDSAIMNEINVGESYYIIARERGMDKADYFMETVLPNLPIRIISNSFEDIIEAARIKAVHPISYADCFAVSTAIREKAVILTGDPEFKKVRNLVEVEWL
ncbi:MAG: type II toxin-antitoxin system VapC family toxin [Deltaproteobacteria bacterium]|nr:type II toxin-antitoxin system VapC family toxin [Deltaproteobacteria bacterium]